MQASFHWKLVGNRNSNLGKLSFEAALVGYINNVAYRHVQRMMDVKLNNMH